MVSLVVGSPPLPHQLLLLTFIGAVGATLLASVVVGDSAPRPTAPIKMLPQLSDVLASLLPGRAGGLDGACAANLPAIGGLPLRAAPLGGLPRLLRAVSSALPPVVADRSSVSRLGCLKKLLMATAGVTPSLDMPLLASLAPPK